MNLDASGKQEKTVVLVNRCMYLPGDGGYKRTMFLFDLMRREGHKPILLTSDFNHYTKVQRDTQAFRKNYPEYNDIVILHTGTYSKNISLKRRIVEMQWTNGVINWVKNNLNDIDVIMMAMPDMDTILGVKKLCEDHKIEIVIDVRDLRPEVFKVLIKNELLYKILTYPLKLKADRAYACADKMVAVSEEYLNRGKVANSHATVNKVIYIGSVLDKFDNGVTKYADTIIKSKNELWITYVGTLGTSYDLITAIDAVHALKDRVYDGKKIRLMILGEGPDKKLFEEHTKIINAGNVSFIGFVEYEKMAAYLSKTDITVNAIKKRASQSIINKVADYFAAGVPMLNGCTCQEQIDMVIKYNVGLNYEPENVESLKDAITKLATDPKLMEEMGRNARELAEKKFDRNITYKDLINILYE